MPGIVGVASFGPRLASDLPVERVLARLRHHPRVMASVTSASHGRAVLGVTDLGVLIRSGSSCVAPDGSLAVVHGEVTRPEPTPNLAQVVLAHYRRDPTALQRIEGSFAVAIWDAARSTLVLAHDRFGLRNVYYTTTPDGLVCFAPLVNALLAFGLPTPAINMAGIADFLAFEHMLGDETLLRGVHALPPATIARFDARGVHLERYWTPRYRPAPTRRCDEWVDEFARRLGAAATRSIALPPRTGLPISGGLDSRAILAVARSALSPVTPCFTYGVPGCDGAARPTGRVPRARVSRMDADTARLLRPPPRGGRSRRRRILRLHRSAGLVGAPDCRCTRHVRARRARRRPGPGRRRQVDAHRALAGRTGIAADPSRSPARRSQARDRNVALDRAAGNSCERLAGEEDEPRKASERRRAIGPFVVSIRVAVRRARRPPRDTCVRRAPVEDVEGRPDDAIDGPGGSPRPASVGGKGGTSKIDRAGCRVHDPWRRPREARIGRRRPSQRVVAGAPQRAPRSTAIEVVRIDNRTDLAAEPERCAPRDGGVRRARGLDRTTDEHSSSQVAIHVPAADPATAGSTPCGPNCTEGAMSAGGLQRRPLVAERAKAIS